MAIKFTSPICPTLLRFLVDYDRETGSLTWRKRPDFLFEAQAAGRGRKSAKACAATWNARYQDTPALCSLRNGYFAGELRNRPVKSHRAAWAIHYGFWPDQPIDHIDRDRTNNRLCNLRAVSPQQNSWNGESGRKAGKLPGAYFDKRRGTWFTSLRINGKLKSYGPFDSDLQAHEKYLTLRLANDPF